MFETTMRLLPRSPRLAIKPDEHREVELDTIVQSWIRAGRKDEQKSTKPLARGQMELHYPSLVVDGHS